MECQSHLWPELHNHVRQADLNEARWRGGRIRVPRVGSM